ncbi:putative leucine-rich repeat-containing protein DDB_G0290503 isoform X2 [Halyomorpha halys]|uniref:putative leucine-rich repeat-containing protein DDB_G0290503 isoform X2 n=1 Tax=Halyomorpha halys TaxID=286706 RepID=UPI0006D4F6C6|nr:uncharacterized protein PFB0765w isoform X2 [Halyomorpha halys]
MSYIHQRERVFNKKGGLSLISAIKLKIPGRLKSVSPYTDPRAWSLDRNSQRKYFLDSISRHISNGSSSSGDECLPPIPPKKRRSSFGTKVTKLKSLVRKAISAEQLKCLRPQSDRSKAKLAEANAKISQLNSQKEQLEKASQEYQQEIDNLRTLVGEVQEELCFLHGLKDENIKLRAELRGDVHKRVSNAEEEINHLNSQLEIYKEYKFKYENLRSCNEQLKDEYDQIRLLFKEMEWNNTQLQNEIKSLKSKVDTLESRELVISNATVDKEVLRERLQMREEKIACLISFLEEKEMTIQELVVQLQRLTSSVVAKDGVTGKHITSLKLALHEKIIKVEELEDKLHCSELLIRELENIRDHFRLSNCALTENMQNYKKQFNIVVSCSKKLISELELCKAEIDDKDLLIRKLSIFPQSASSIVQFAQLLNILKSTEEMIETDWHGAVSFIPTMRRIVDQLKGEIIGDRIQYPLYEIYDSHSQTDFKGVDKCIQNEIFYIEHKSVEVWLPDRYYFAYEKSQTEIAELNAVIEALKESFLRVDSVNHSLEKKIITSMAEKSTKEREISSMHEKLVTVNEEMKFLRNEIDLNYSLLNKSLYEIEIEKGLRESTSEMFLATLDSTTHEYNMYVKVLESLLKYKEEKIKCLEDYLCNEPQKDEIVENEHITLLENELKHTSIKYIKEKQTVKTLTIQISKLQGALSEKMEHFKIVQEKLLRAEKIFEHLNNIENQCMLKFEHTEESSVIPTEEMVVTASNKILSHSEMLESHLKEEKDLKEKLLRETVSREYVSNLMQRNSSHRKYLKKTIYQLKNNIKRIKYTILKLRNKLKLSEKLNQDYDGTLLQLQAYGSEVKKEVDYMKDQLQMEKSMNKNLQISLEMKNKEQYDQRNKFKKVECILVRIIKQFEKRGKSNVVSTQTNLLFRDKEKEISDLKAEIKKLITENVSLSSTIENLKERLANILYVPQKENHPPQTLSVFAQTDLIGEDGTLSDMRNHYENIIQVLQKDKALEKEEIEKQFKNILIKITEAYEKDLVNKQSLHNMELEELKVSHQEKCKDHINRYELEEVHKEEIEKQKSHYEALVKIKEIEEDELNKEIKELKEEVGKIIAQKKKEDSMFNDKIKIQLINLKKKFKKQYKCLKKVHEAELLQLNNKYNEVMKKINIAKSSMECQTEITGEAKSSINCQTVAFDGTQLNNSQHLTEQLDNSERTTLQTKESQGNKEGFDYSINTNHNKKIDINFKERIKCSFKEANGMIPKEIFNILNALRPSAKILSNALNLCINDKTDQSAKKQTVSDICFSLINGADVLEADCQDMLKTLSMFGKCSSKEKAIIEEMRDISNKRSNNYYTLQQRLDLEYERAEQLRHHRDELSNVVFKLKNQLANLEADLRFEKTKNENLNKLVTSMKTQRRTSEKLEMSLEVEDEIRKGRIMRKKIN